MSPFCSSVGRIALALLTGAAVEAQGPTSPTAAVVLDEGATMADRLGGRARFDTAFTDETGQRVVLADVVSGARPVIVNLGYFGCPGMCGAVLNQLVDGMQSADLLPGRDVDVLTVSIDAREGPDLASKKKTAYLEAFGRPAAAAHWRFLTGDADAIAALSDSVGFRFRWNEHSAQFDHPPVVVLVSPEGYVTRYLNALTTDPRTLRRAVVETGEGRVGTFLERVVVSCLTFDPDRGAYSLTAMTVMRIGGAVTVLALAILIFTLRRQEKKSRAAPAAATT